MGIYTSCFLSFINNGELLITLKPYLLKIKKALASCEGFQKIVIVYYYSVTGVTV